MFFILDSVKPMVYLSIGGNLSEINSESISTFLDIHSEKQTWNYSSELKNIKNIQYASLYCKELNMNKICPEFLKEDLNLIQNKLFNILKTIKFCNITESSLINLIPVEVLSEYTEIQSKICKYVFSNYEKPENYDFLVNLTKTLDLISKRKLKINKEKISFFKKEKKGIELYNNIDKYSLYLKYNIYGIITGRLNLEPGCFPIYNLKKEYREIIEPRNDYFIELDYNGMDIRSIFALLEIEQPKEDIHEWNNKELLGGVLTRSEAKNVFFAWMFGSSSPEILKYSALLEKVYNKKKLLDKFWKDGVVCNLYGRKIKVDKHKAISYLVQSTSTDIVLRKMIEISDLLNKHKSFLSLTIHDSFLLDFSIKEEYLIEKLIDVAEKTDFGLFKTRVSKGENFGRMKLL